MNYSVFKEELEKLALDIPAVDDLQAEIFAASPRRSRRWRSAVLAAAVVVVLVTGFSLVLRHGFEPSPQMNSAAPAKIATATGWITVPASSDVDGYGYYRASDGALAKVAAAQDIEPAVGGNGDSNWLIVTSRAGQMALPPGRTSGTINIGESRGAWSIGRALYYQSGTNVLRRTLPDGTGSSLTIPNLPTVPGANTFDGHLRKGIPVPGVLVDGVLTAPNGHVVALISDTNSAGVFDTVTGLTTVLAGYSAIWGPPRRCQNLSCRLQLCPVEIDHSTRIVDRNVIGGGRTLRYGLRTRSHRKISRARYRNHERRLRRYPGHHHD